MVAGDGIAVRFRSAPATGGCGGTLHYILQRTVVLDKVEVRGGDGTEWDAEIADDGNGFEKNFRQQDGGAPIEIDAAGVHLLNESAKETEVVMRGVAKRSAVGGGVHVRDVRTDGEMDRHGNAVFVRSNEDAGTCVFVIDAAAREELPGSFTVADVDAVRKFGEFVDVLAGFGGHAELAFTDAGFDVFGGVAGQRDFEIMDERRAVHGDAGNEAAFHQIDQDGAETDLDHVAADAPKDGLTLSSRAVDCAEEMAEIFRGKDVWE